MGATPPSVTPPSQRDSSFSNCLAGVQLAGIAAYHTGAGADQNRGNWIRGCRFHDIGAAATDAAIEVTPDAKVLHATIESNLFDSNGFGRHVVAVGTSAAPHRQLRLAGNKHMEAGANVYDLTYVNYSQISDAQINGNTVTGNGHAFDLANCTDVQIGNVLAVQVGKSGVYARSCARLNVRDSVFSIGGIDPATSHHGLDVDASNSTCKFERVSIVSFDGYGFSGEPPFTALEGCEFNTNTLGAINSATVVNRMTKALNTYTEGKFGRYEDEGRKARDLPAGVATAVATIAGGGNFSSFMFEVSYTARDGGGDCYVSNRYSVRTENGAPVVTALGTASASRVTVSTAAAGGSGVTVSLTSTAASYGVVVIRAWSGGAANGTNPRGVTVTMA